MRATLFHRSDTFDFLGFTHISGKTRLGRVAVRRLTIRKRMRSKLREVKQQLRQRMHDPVPQTGAWLRSVVQGYFNYYAVPGNIGSLSLFRVGYLGVGGTRYVAVANNACPGHACSSWVTAGCLARVCSILIPQFALPLLIRDKNRMR